MPQGARDFHSSSVRLHDGLDDREPESGPLQRVVASRPAPLVEDARQIGGRNANAVVADIEHHLTTLAVHGQPH